MEALLSKAVEVAAGGDAPVDPSVVPMPEFDSTINLGTPSEAISKARKRLQEIERETIAPRKAEIDAVRAEIAKEQKVIDAAVYDIATELKKGSTRASLAARKSAAEVAEEISQLKRAELDVLKSKMERERRAVINRNERLMTWIQNLEIATRANQISLIRNNGPDRLNTQKAEKAFYNMLAFKKLASETLGDELADEVFEAITLFVVPNTLEEALWLQLTARGKTKFAEHEPITIQLNTNDKEAK